MRAPSCATAGLLTAATKKQNIKPALATYLDAAMRWTRTCPIGRRPLPRRAKTLLLDALAARDLAPEARPAAAAELTERLGELCQARSSHEPVRRLLAHMAKEAPAMFSFLGDDQVDATNWRAEQGIRPAVVNRKVWGGNRTDRGGRAQGTIMSVMRTAAQHGVDVIDYLASRARGPDPGLAVLLGH